MRKTIQSRLLGTPVLRSGLLKFSMAGFLVSLGLLIVVTPFVLDLPWGDLIEAVLLSMVLLSAVLAVGGQRRALMIGVLLVIPPAIGKWVNHFRPDLLPAPWFIVGGIVFCVFIVSRLLAFILRSPRVTGEVLCAGISGYLMLGVTWGFSYLLLNREVPNAFSPSGSGKPYDAFDMLYFSFITLNTIGYGDIVPVSRAARMLAMVEGTVGVMYSATLIARLVSLYSGHSSPEHGMPPAAHRDTPAGDSMNEAAK